MVDTEVGFENTHPLAEGGPRSGFPRDSIPQEATARSPNFEDNFEELEALRRDTIGDISGFFDDSAAESSPARTDYDSEAAGASYTQPAEIEQTVDEFMGAEAARHVAEERGSMRPDYPPGDNGAVIRQLTEWEDAGLINGKERHLLGAYYKASIPLFNATVELQVAYSRALKYFCREILSPSLITRVKNYRANHELRSQQRAPWSNLKYYITRGVRDPSAACALLDWLLLVRAEGSSCENWMEIQDTHALELQKHNIVMPPELAMQFIVNQFSPEERKQLDAPADRDLRSITLQTLRERRGGLDEDRLGYYKRSSAGLQALVAAAVAFLPAAHRDARAARR